jgi:hypothetical protein
MKELIINGDVYDIGQTIGGVSRFLYLNGKWYYFEATFSTEYQYDQDDLRKLVKENEFDEVKLIGNIFQQF